MRPAVHPESANWSPHDLIRQVVKMRTKLVLGGASGPFELVLGSGWWTILCQLHWCRLERTGRKTVVRTKSGESQTLLERLFCLDDIQSVSILESATVAGEFDVSVEPWPEEI